MRIRSGGTGHLDRYSGVPACSAGSPIRIRTSSGTLVASVTFHRHVLASSHSDTRRHARRPHGEAIMNRPGPGRGQASDGNGDLSLRTASFQVAYA
jgi:hypothetical protein